MKTPFVTLQATAFATWLSTYLTRDEMKRLILVLNQTENALTSILVEDDLYCKECREKEKENKEDNPLEDQQREEEEENFETIALVGGDDELIADI